MKQGTQSSQNPVEIRQMFNDIAPTYDRLNHLLSFGLDKRWRAKAISFLSEYRNGTFLDIAAGSGDVSFDLLQLLPQRIVAVDFAPNMLNVFREKIHLITHHAPIEVLQGDALDLPFDNGTFDGTIVAFGIRNFSDRLLGLREMMRVLKPGGTSVILELSKPRAPVISQCYLIYTYAILPLIGKIISKNSSAYTYLPKSIADFPEQKSFLQLMTEAGFHEVVAHTLTFGTVTIYTGKK